MIRLVDLVFESDKSVKEAGLKRTIGEISMRTIALLFFLVLCASCSSSTPDADSTTAQSSTPPATAGENAVQIHYLEIVTEDVESVCAAYAAADGLVFGEPDALLGNEHGLWQLDSTQ